MMMLKLKGVVVGTAILIVTALCCL